MRLWWPRRRNKIESMVFDRSGRRTDGDTIPIPGYGRWADLLDQEHTRLLPIITPAMRHRRRGGGGWE